MVVDKIEKNNSFILIGEKFLGRIYWWKLYLI